MNESFTVWSKSMLAAIAHFNSQCVTMKVWNQHSLEPNLKQALLCSNLTLTTGTILHPTLYWSQFVILLDWLPNTMEIFCWPPISNISQKMYLPQPLTLIWLQSRTPFNDALRPFHCWQHPFMSHKMRLNGKSKDHLVS